MLFIFPKDLKYLFPSLMVDWCGRAGATQYDMRNWYNNIKNIISNSSTWWGTVTISHYLPHTKLQQNRHSAMHNPNWGVMTQFTAYLALDNCCASLMWDGNNNCSKMVRAVEMLQLMRQCKRWWDIYCSAIKKKDNEEVTEGESKPCALTGSVCTTHVSTC